MSSKAFSYKGFRFNSKIGSATCGMWVKKGMWLDLAWRYAPYTEGKLKLIKKNCWWLVGWLCVKSLHLSVEVIGQCF
jgi:hypothetical protein